MGNSPTEIVWLTRRVDHTVDDLHESLVPDLAVRAVCGLLALLKIYDSHGTDCAPMAEAPLQLAVLSLQVLHGDPQSSILALNSRNVPR